MSPRVVHVLLILTILPLLDCQVTTQSTPNATTQSSMTLQQLLPLIWRQLGQFSSPTQLHIAYCSNSPFYSIGAQTILNSYQLASQAASAQQKAMDVQVKAFFVASNFTFLTGAELLVELFMFQADLIVSDDNWLTVMFSEALGVSNLLLYSSFPNLDNLNALVSNFLVGYFYKINLPSSAAFYQLNMEIQSTSISNSTTANEDYSYYNYNYDGGSMYYYQQLTNYYYSPPNKLNYLAPLISYNPYTSQIKTILLNVTVILDASLPYGNDMAMFQSLCTSVISTQSSTALFILTIPIGATQSVYDNCVTSLMSTPGPRFVFSTTPVAQQLIASINRVGSFTTSFTQPVYQWHFLNLTGGYQYDNTYNSFTSAPYMFHWELYNMSAFQAQCPNASCSSCGNNYERLLDCDFGMYLNDLIAAYLTKMNVICPGSLSNCTGSDKISTLSALLPTIIANPAYASGPMAFQGENRVGGYTNIYLGINQANAQLRVACTSTNNWTCSYYPYIPPPQRVINVQFVVLNVAPFYYVNESTGKYDGFYAAFAQLIASQTGIVNYTITSSTKIGAYHAGTGSWNGVIGAILGPADIALAPLVGIANLSQSLSFSNPYLQVSMSALQQVPDPTTTVGDLFYLIFRPFSAYNWVLQAGCIVAVALIMTTIDYFSPNLVPFGLQRSWFYVFARSVMGAGGQNPDVFSSQILMLFWSFVTMITISTYTANLAALTIDNQQSSQYISSFTDLLNSQWTPCCVSNSFVSTYFSSSAVPFEMAVWTVMSQCQFATQPEAIATLSNWSNPAASSMVLVVIQPVASYFSSTYENLVITANYSLINLLVAVPAGLQAPVSVYKINKAIQNLTTTGQLGNIKNTYLNLAKASFPADAWTRLSLFFGESTSTVFTIKNMFGIFFITFSGIVFTLSLSGIERYAIYTWTAYTDRKRRETEEFMKFELSCTVEANNKPKMKDSEKRELKRSSENQDTNTNKAK